MFRLFSPLVFLVLCALATDAQARVVEKRWVDEEGVEHISLRIGPSPQARARASKEDVAPRAAGKRMKVRDSTEWDHVIEAAARKYVIPPELVRAVIVAESNFDPQAVSHVGARGLMQLMPRTAKEMYVDDPHDPEQNIHGGVRYLRILTNMFEGDIVKVIAAYNAGPNAVRRNGGIPPYRETQDYVRKVIRLYALYRGAQG